MRCTTPLGLLDRAPIGGASEFALGGLGKYLRESEVFETEAGFFVGTSSLRAGRAPVTMHVPFAASSVAVARRKLKNWLEEGSVTGPLVDDARIVISELVANSVRHAQPLPGGDIEITWALEPRGLTITVSDGGSATRPRRVQAASSALAGRGMAIVESLALTWWSDQSRARSSVHAVLEV